MRQLVAAQEMHLEAVIDAFAKGQGKGAVQPAALGRGQEILVVARFGLVGGGGLGRCAARICWWPPAAGRGVHAAGAVAVGRRGKLEGRAYKERVDHFAAGGSLPTRNTAKVSEVGEERGEVKDWQPRRGRSSGRESRDADQEQVGHNGMRCAFLCDRKRANAKTA